MSNGNAHDRSNPPAVLVGGAHGRLKGNRHIVAKKDEPTANLLLAMAHLAGAEIESLGREHWPIGLVARWICSSSCQSSTVNVTERRARRVSGSALSAAGFSFSAGSPAARGKSPSAFGERCIPPRSVAQRSNTPGILASGVSRLAIPAPRPPRCDDGLPHGLPGRTTAFVFFVVRELAILRGWMAARR